jgi:uncharacterized protein (DUF58 family)
LALLRTKAQADAAHAADHLSLMGHEAEGHGLADRLPELSLEAQRIAATVSHGVHGRRRSGPGENFWQFRQLTTGDPTHLIDWRRSASSDHLYIREREWETAHTVWLWPDLSPSMAFKSHLAPVSKRERTLVLMFALGEMLIRAGERVAVMGVTQPSQFRKTTTKIAEMLSARLRDKSLLASQPPEERIGRYASTIWLSDFLDPIEQIAPRMKSLAANGTVGHLIQVLDPAEETLPYAGRTEFVGVEGSDRWIADRAESLRDAYQARLAAHRDELSSLCRSLGWSFAVHHTDHTATEPVLALTLRLAGLTPGTPAAVPAASEAS